MYLVLVFHKTLGTKTIKMDKYPRIEDIPYSEEDYYSYEVHY
jgi:hypothetical protein